MKVGLYPGRPAFPLVYAPPWLPMLEGSPDWLWPTIMQYNPNLAPGRRQAPAQPPAPSS